VYTLRNYRKRVNCSLTALYPASVKVLSLNVGLQDVEVETGTVHKVSYILMLTGEDCSSNSTVLTVGKGGHKLSHTDPELMSCTACFPQISRSIVSTQDLKLICIHL